MKKKKDLKRKKPFKYLWMGLTLLSLLFLLSGCILTKPPKDPNASREEPHLSTAVKNKAGLLETYAIKHEVGEHLGILLAIMQVESAGLSTDIMQSSESLGLKPNSLTTEESIDQGCRYFAKLLRLADEKGCDLNTVIQAYNYGDTFISYIAENGGVYSFELAEAYAAEKADHAKITYINFIALMENGGWRYQYGNMFYVKLVNQYL